MAKANLGCGSDHADLWSADIYIQTGRLTFRHTNIHTASHTGRLRQSGIPGMHTERGTGRQAVRQTKRQTDRPGHIYIYTDKQALTAATSVTSSARYIHIQWGIHTYLQT